MQRPGLGQQQVSLPAQELSALQTIPPLPRRQEPVRHLDHGPVAPRIQVGFGRVVGGLHGVVVIETPHVDLAQRDQVVEAPAAVQGEGETVERTHRVSGELQALAEVLQGLLDPLADSAELEVIRIVAILTQEHGVHDLVEPTQPTHDLGIAGGPVEEVLHGAQCPVPHLRGQVAVEGHGHGAQLLLVELLAGLASKLRGTTGGRIGGQDALGLDQALLGALVEQQQPDPIQEQFSIVSAGSAEQLLETVEGLAVVALVPVGTVAQVQQTTPELRVPAQADTARLQEVQHRDGGVELSGLVVRLRFGQGAGRSGEAGEGVDHHGQQSEKR